MLKMLQTTIRVCDFLPLGCVHSFLTLSSIFWPIFKRHIQHLQRQRLHFTHTPPIHPPGFALGHPRGLIPVDSAWTRTILGRCHFLSKLRSSRYILSSLRWLSTSFYSCLSINAQGTLFFQRLSSKKTKRLTFVLNLCPDRNAKNLESPHFLYYTLLLTKKYFY